MSYLTWKLESQIPCDYLEAPTPGSHPSAPPQGSTQGLRVPGPTPGSWVHFTGMPNKFISSFSIALNKMISVFFADTFYKYLDNLCFVNYVNRKDISI